jgi:predicted Co/Zn/Cd cation transporter (cation efflux family)
MKAIREAMRKQAMRSYRIEARKWVRTTCIALALLVVAILAAAAAQIMAWHIALDLIVAVSNLILALPLLTGAQLVREGQPQTT